MKHIYRFLLQQMQDVGVQYSQVSISNHVLTDNHVQAQGGCEGPSFRPWTTFRRARVDSCHRECDRRGY